MTSTRETKGYSQEKSGRYRSIKDRFLHKKSVETSERFNMLTHLIGAAAAVVGTILLVITAIEESDPWKITGFAIYGISLVLLYMASTLYHAFTGKLKGFFKKVDHLAIYLLIAGSYTPFLLGPLRETVGWSVFITVWSLVLVGFVVEFLPWDKRRVIPLLLYLGMGWFAVFLAKPMLEALTMQGFLWVIAGGLFYTGGVAFYVFDHKHRYAHGVWHLFVLAGSTSHYVAILGYV